MYQVSADGRRAAGSGQRAAGKAAYEREAARASEGDEGLEAQPGARTLARVFHALNGGWCVSPGGRWTVAENGRNLGQALILREERGSRRLAGGASGGGVPEE